MKITMLGSSHGVPEKDRLCTCILLETDHHKYLIDGGAPAASLLIARGISPSEIDAVFVTHAHGDHVNGLVEMIDLQTWFFTDSHTKYFFPEQPIVHAIRGMLLATHGGTVPRQVEMTSYAEGPLWDDGDLKVTAIRNGHMPAPRRTCSFLMESQGRRLLFTGDMSNTFSDFPADQGQLDMVFCEAAHCRLENAVPYLSRAATKRMVFHHIAPINQELRPLDLPFPMEYAGDGSEYTV